MIDKERTLAAYERAWESEEEPAIRAELERCWTPASTHVSPLSGVVHGVEGLLHLILDFPVIFPDARVKVTGRGDLHHDQTYLTWQLTSTARIRMMGHDYGRALHGIDFVEFDPGGAIRRITSFFDTSFFDTGWWLTGSEACPADGHTAAEPVRNGSHQHGFAADGLGKGRGNGTPEILHLDDPAQEPQHR